MYQGDKALRDRLLGLSTEQVREYWKAEQARKQAAGEAHYTRLVNAVTGKVYADINEYQTERAARPTKKQRRVARSIRNFAGLEAALHAVPLDQAAWRNALLEEWQRRIDGLPLCEL